MVLPLVEELVFLEQLLLHVDDLQLNILNLVDILVDLLEREEEDLQVQWIRHLCLLASEVILVYGLSGLDDLLLHEVRGVETLDQRIYHALLVQSE